MHFPNYALYFNLLHIHKAPCNMQCFHPYSVQEWKGQNEILVRQRMYVSSSTMSTWNAFRNKRMHLRETLRSAGTQVTVFIWVWIQSPLKTMKIPIECNACWITNKRVIALFPSLFLCLKAFAHFLGLLAWTTVQSVI